MLTINAHRDVGLTVVSAAAGRTHLYANGFRIDGGRAVAIEEAVGKLTGVHAVRVYPRTASVVIRYSPRCLRHRCRLVGDQRCRAHPAASVPARAPYSADTGDGGMVDKVTGGTGRTLLGLRHEIGRAHV